MRIAMSPTDKKEGLELLEVNLRKKEGSLLGDPGPQSRRGVRA